MITFAIQYGNITRHIVDFDGTEQELIAAIDTIVAAQARGDTRWASEGGTNADLVSATAAVTP